MEKVNHRRHASWDARYEEGVRPKTLQLSTCSRSLLLSVVVAFLTTFFLSKQWHAAHPHDVDAVVNYRISAAELGYGLSQCALNQQRPTVDKSLPATRLAQACHTPGRRTVLRNATLVDGDGTVTPGCHIEIQGGIFTRVYTGDEAPLYPSAGKDVTVMELRGRVVTPGLVDAHSHAGVRATPQLWATEDVTEASFQVTPWGRAIDALKPHDPAIPIIAAGGVTTSLVLTGAKNLISGEGIVIKMKQANSALGLVLQEPCSCGGETHETHEKPKPKPQRYLKMAAGENQKRQFQNTPGGPVTRIGESYWFRRAYEAARRVKAEQDRWCDAAASPAGRQLLASEYPRSLEWQTLVDVLRGDVRVHVHGYESEDLLAVLDHADEFAFNVTAFHHALHSDQVAAAIKARGIVIVGFSDSWGDKQELYNVSSYLPRRMADQGIPFALTRDHPAEHGRWLAYEAQIAHHFGLDAAHAIASIISEPARLLGLENRLGYVRPGYDADLVVWDRHPLRVGATPLAVFIDGETAVRASDSFWDISEGAVYGREAPASRPSDDVKEGACRVGQSDLVVRGITTSFVGTDDTRTAETKGSNLTVVIRAGEIICVGQGPCDNAARQAADEGVPFVNLQDGHMLPVRTGRSRGKNCRSLRVFSIKS